jgi:hypothetical protein
MLMPSRVEAKLTDDAWEFYGSMEETMVHAATKSPFADIALPTFERLTKSLLKISLLVAITRREPNDNNILIVEKSDLEQAAWYIQRWGEHSIHLMMNAGKSDLEKTLDRVMKYIRDHPGTTRSEITTKHRLWAKQMNDLTETMLMRGLVTVAKKGRETRFYPV